MIDSRTGAHSVWRGGLNRPGAAFAIRGRSLTGDGRSLAYVAQWCYLPDGVTGPAAGSACVPGNSQQATRFTQVREIGTSAAGGALSSGRVLLAPSARTIAQVLVSRDGTSLTAIVLSGPQVASGGSGGRTGPRQLSVVRISVATGAETALLYRAVDPEALVATLAADSSGQYLILGHTDFQESNGWIDGGHLRKLPSQNGAPAAW